MITRRRFCAAGAGLALASALACTEQGAPRAALARVALLPLLPAPSDADLAAIEAQARALFAVDFVLLPAAPLFASAYFAPHARHRADVLLRELAALRPAGAAKILGVTAGDISTTMGAHPDWGVLGLSDVGGAAAVASRFRCARSARDAAHARERLARICAHELGHAFGSPHCATPGCLMEGARGRVRTFDRERAFCAATASVLAERGGALR